jgi:hypothetical protein
MSYTIYKSTSALIAQPGRAVNTFPSGLVRVDQVYLGLTANAATHRATLAVGNNMPAGDSSPCIDGLKIFPEVQERRREDGWTEYIVSAYGRANSSYLESSNFEFARASSSFGNSNNVVTQGVREGLFQRVVIKKTVPSSTVPAVSLPAGYVPKVFVFANQEEAERLSVPQGTPVLVAQAFPGSPIPFPGGVVIKSHGFLYETQLEEIGYGDFKEQILSVLIKFYLNEYVDYSS